MANEEKELHKFVYNPKYREKVIARVHKERDKQYNKGVKRVKSERDKLVKSRSKEISRISNSRWEISCGGKLWVNRTEGKVRINYAEYLFSSIQGAQLNIINGSRIETTSNSKSKKHVSLGWAVAGGVVVGPVGAVVAGSTLGKTKTKGSSVSNQIPTCDHLGVFVTIDGFVQEVVFISSPVDQTSPAFSRAQRDAQNLIAQLSVLSRTPVPESFIRPEDESSVKVIDAQIVDKEQELQKVIEDKPVYTLPDMYRMEENKELSDEDYLQYLINTDSERMAENDSANSSILQNLMGEDYKQKLKTIGGVIGKVIFWFFSIVCLLYAVISLTTKGGMLSVIYFVVTGMIINPITTAYIRSEGVKLSVWYLIIILIVGFMAGVYSYSGV